MTFEQLYLEVLKLWPEKIDVSDGIALEHGVLFRNLSTFWDEAEIKAKVLGEWYDLMTWIIFGNLHSLAKEALQAGEGEISLEQIDIENIKFDLLENLKLEDYRDMLLEFESNCLKV